MDSRSKLTSYVRNGKNAVSGWLARCDSEILATLLSSQLEQNITGSVVEIGVHHGKSFIPMALSNDGQACYAIDIFGRQEFNLDASGSGDKLKFIDNMARFGVPTEGVVIDERLSTHVSPEDILSRVGPARYFHVDGGHHLEAIINDLFLAEAVLCDEGVIAVDDVFRPEWPEVTFGLASFLEKQSKDFVPFAIGFNKTYLCRAACAEKYRSVLLASDFLTMYLNKRYKITKEEILVYQAYALPEWDMKERLLNYLKVYHPDFAYFLRSIGKPKIKVQSIASATNAQLP